ncbi:hypothetical protein BDV95DRAFT_23533 [Massariosphaeria phaeospora]|uniref:Secreted protein n=1 Tax=Massariosphaeria phaeospora TaxID=100035 RepID=A0A7C8MZ25_9PLEO|nr:hypothetical protein BDV95DRAFT_23533 [Massariosphaeria phaeospora]
MICLHFMMLLILYRHARCLKPTHPRASLFLCRLTAQSQLGHARPRAPVLPNRLVLISLFQQTPILYPLNFPSNTCRNPIPILVIVDHLLRSEHCWARETVVRIDTALRSCEGRMPWHGHVGETSVRRVFRRQVLGETDV